VVFTEITHLIKHIIENTERAIKNGHSRETVNIGCTRHRTKTNKATQTKTKQKTEITKTMSNGDNKTLQSLSIVSNRENKTLQSPSIVLF
jgi:hypothetical protein